MSPKTKIQNGQVLLTKHTKYLVVAISKSEDSINLYDITGKKVVFASLGLAENELKLWANIPIARIIPSDNVAIIETL